MQTKTRILDAALLLFNASGTATVSTNHIAEAAEISPGNLYYHYRNKEAIIRGLYERLDAIWERVFQLPPDRLPTLDDLQSLVRLNFATLWDHRFLYRELGALLRRDPALQERYQAVRRRGFANLCDLLTAFVAAEVLTIPADAVTDVATLCWMVTDFWLPYVEMNGAEVDAAQLQHGVELLMRVLNPYLTGGNR